MKKWAAVLSAAGAALLLLAYACGGGSDAPSPSPTATTPADTRSPAVTYTPTATPEPKPQAPAFDADRALEHVRVLASEIGSRPAGSEAEHRAAEYIRDQLASYGYDADLQTFPFSAVSRSFVTLDVTAPEQRQLLGVALSPPTEGLAEGRLVAAGVGRPEEFPEDTAGAIALIERGTLFFADKVKNAAQAGAVAAIIYNNQPGIFSGQLNDRQAIPSVSVSREDGLYLLDLLAQGAVNVRLEVTTQTLSGESQNVIGLPPEGDCRLVVGGHYDSVSAGPGANDNASGTAVVLEIARTLAADGEFAEVCFVLFGAEEIGLLGSGHYVRSIRGGLLDSLEAMLNFDMVGVGDRWLLAGSASAVLPASEVADDLGIAHRTAPTLPSDTGSDHFHFMQAGVPAMIFHRLDDPNYHTAQDRPEFIDRDSLTEVGRLGLAVIEALLDGRR